MSLPAGAVFISSIDGLTVYYLVGTDGRVDIYSTDGSGNEGSYLATIAGGTASSEFFGVQVVSIIGNRLLFVATTYTTDPGSESGSTLPLTTSVYTDTLYSTDGTAGGSQPLVSSMYGGKEFNNGLGGIVLFSTSDSNTYFTITTETGKSFADGAAQYETTLYSSDGTLAGTRSLLIDVKYADPAFTEGLGGIDFLSTSGSNTFFTTTTETFGYEGAEEFQTTLYSLNTTTGTTQNLITVDYADPAFNEDLGGIDFLLTSESTAFFTTTTETFGSEGEKFQTTLYSLNTITGTIQSLITATYADSAFNGGRGGIQLSVDGIATLVVVTGDNNVTQRFWITADGALVPAGDDYTWMGPASGSWSTAANWEDVTAGTNPASAVPGANDSVTFNSPSNSFQVISGSGSAAYLTLNGNNLVAGQLTVGTLASFYGSLDIGAGGNITAATASLGPVAIETDGQLTVNGTLTLDSDISVAGQLTVGTLESTGGSLDIGAGGNITVATAYLGPVTIATGGQFTVSGTRIDAMSITGDAGSSLVAASAFLTVATLTLSATAVLDGSAFFGFGPNGFSLNMLAGSQMNLTGFAQLYNPPEAVELDNGSGTIDGGTLDAAGGSVDIFGTLLAEGGAQVTALDTSSNMAGSGTTTYTGTLTITGPNTNWHDVGSYDLVNGATYDTGYMFVPGTLIVSDHATLAEDGFASIDGAATITGGALWTIGTELIVNSGGTLVVSDDATVTEEGEASAGGIDISGDLIVEDGGQVTALVTSLYSGNGATGTLTITGPDTSWHDIGSYDVVNGVTYDTYAMSVIGGTLMVSDDATLTDDGSAAIYDGGATTITGGALWTIGTSLAVGANVGGAVTTGTLAIGTLAIESGGTVEAASLSVGATGQVSLLAGSKIILTSAANPSDPGIGFNLAGGGTIDGGTLDATDDNIVVTGTLLADGGAQITALQTSLGGVIGEIGTLTLTGPNTGWHDVGSYDVVNGDTYYLFDMLVNEGILIASDDATLTEDGSADIDNGGTATITSGAVWTIGTSLAVGANVGGAVTTGTLAIETGGTVEAASLSVGATGQVSLLAGSKIILTAAASPSDPGIGFNLAGGGTIDGGTLDATNDNIVLTGSLLADGGAQITAFQTDLDGGSSEVGTLTITGPNTSWHDVGSYDVANGGTNYWVDMSVNDGILIVRDDAALIEEEVATIGNGGAATITGGAAWTIGTALIVGEGGTGALTIESGGTVDSTGTGFGAITVGLYSGSNGVVSIEAGSTLEATAALNSNQAFLEIGEYGTDTITNTSGAVTAITPAANGAIYVEGTGALLTTDGNPAQIGADGNGTLSVTDGATASFGDSDVGTYAALGVALSGNGTVIVSGTGSRLTVTGSTFFAESGTASLTVSNNATFTVGDATYGLALGDGYTTGVAGSATANVTSGGDLKSLSYLAVGVGGDTATLNITDGTVEAVDRVFVGRAPNSGPVAGGAGIVTIGAGGTLLADGSTLATSTTSALSIASGSGSNGTIDVSGSGALLNTNGHLLNVGAGGTGSLSVSNSGTVTAGSVAIGATGSGFVMLDGASSLLDVSGAITVGGPSSGTLSIASGATVLAGSVSVGLGGVIELTGGELDPPGSIANTSTIGGYGILDDNIDNTGTVTASGGTLEVAGAITDSGGTLEIADHATLKLGGAVASGQTIDFAPGGTNETLDLGSPLNTSAQITGFEAGDAIAFSDSDTIVSASFAGNIMTVIGGGGTIATLTFAPGYDSSKIGTRVSNGVVTISKLPVAKNFGWTGALDTDLGTAGNWADYTDGLYPSPIVPGTLDSAYFGTGTGGSLSGSGTFDNAQFLGSTSDNWTIIGTIDAVGTAGVGIGQGTLTLAATGVVEGTNLNVGANLDMQPGAQMTLTGLASATYLPAALYVAGAGTIDGATLDAAGGQVNINGALTVEGGATVTALATSVSAYNGLTGTLTITGPDTTWHDLGGSQVVNGQTIFTGYLSVGPGVLLITDEAVVTTDAGGYLPGGATTISGGAVWTVGAGINLEGSRGAASLSLLSGGTIHSTGGYDIIGNGAGDTGTAIVDGAGSTWSTSGGLTVGNLGTGDLTVSNGGAVTAAQVIVGGGDGAVGTLTIESGGVVDATGNGYGRITVGNVSGSTGVVHVNAGGTLEVTGSLDPYNPIFVIGNQAAGAGTPAASGAVYVDGAGALLTTSGNPLEVGYDGDGTLSVTAGAKAVVGTSSYGVGSYFALGVGPRGDGNVIVDGAGSSLTASGGAVFAEFGRASLTVSNNGTFIAGDSVEPLDFGNGDIDGTGGTATASVASDGYVESLSNLFVGDGGDTATLTISGGGKVEATDLIRVGTTNTISGGTEAGGTGVVNIGAGGTLLADASDITVGGTSAIAIGNGIGSTGNVDVAGAGALLGSSGSELTIGANGGSGTLTVREGGSVTVGTQFSSYAALAIGSSGGTGLLSVTGSLSTVTAYGQLNVGTSGSIGAIGTGSLDVESGGTVVTGNNPIAVHGGFAIAGNSNSGGSVTVDGPGSEILNTGRFIVGGNENASAPGGGVGTMLIEDGGLVQTSLQAAGNTGPAADIAADPGTGGSSVTVTGAGSTWGVSGALLVGDALAGSLTITNGATVTAGSLEAGVQAGSDGVIEVSGDSTLDITGGVTIGVAGSASLSVGEGTDITIGSMVIGTLGTVALSGIVGTDQVDVSNAGLVEGFGSLAVVFANTGTVIAQGGTLALDNAITGTGGRLEISDHATLKLGGAVASGQTIDFTPGGTNETLELGSPLNTSAQITGFEAGDAIEFTDSDTSVSASFAGNVMTVIGGGGTIATLTFAPGYDSSTTGARVSNGIVTVSEIPTITAPATALLLQGQSTAITGLSLAESTVRADENFTVTVTDTYGELSAPGQAVAGAGSNHLVIVGSLQSVNDALASLTDTDSVTPSDVITVTASDSFGNHATALTTTVTVIAAAPALAITGTQAAQATTDQTAIDPFAHVVIAETDSVTETATVTLSAVADGTLSQLGGGSYDATTGVYTVSGSAADVTAALGGLVFTPTGFQVAPGASVTTGFDLSVTSSSGATASDDTTSVVATAAAVWNIAAGATLEIHGASHGQTIDFQGTAGLLLLDQPSLADLTISGFTSGDHIDLAGVSPSATPVLSGGALSIGALHLGVTGDYAGQVFALVAAADGDAELTVATQTTASGRQVVNLGSGDSNATASGYANRISGTGASDTVVTVTSGLNNSVHLGDGNNVVTTGSNTASSSITLGDGRNQVNLGGTLQTVKLGNGANSVAMSGSNNSITAGNGANSVTGGTGNSSVTLGGGRASVALAGWVNSVTVGDGNDVIDAGAGSATIHLGQGNDTVVLHGRNNTVIGGNGRDSVTGGGLADTVTLGNGDDTVVLGGALNVITLGDGHNTVTAGSGQDRVTVGGGANSITLAGSKNVVVGGNGDNTVTGTASIQDSITLGDGANTVHLDGDHNTIHLGNGADSVTLGGQGNTVTGGNGGVSVTGGGAGNNHVTLGTGNNIVQLSGWGNSVSVGGGTSVVDAGLGASTIQVVGGDVSLTLHGRADMVFLHNTAQASIADHSAGLKLGIDSGNVVASITGFGASSGAVLDLAGAGFTSVAQVLAALHSDGHGGTALALGGAGSVDFQNLAPSALHAGNFSMV